MLGGDRRRAVRVLSNAEPSSHRSCSQDLDLVVPIQPIGDGAQEGPEVLVAAPLGIILSPARSTMAYLRVMPDVGGAAHVRRHVRGNLFGHHPTTPAEDRGRSLSIQTRAKPSGRGKASDDSGGGAASRFSAMAAG